MEMCEFLAPVELIYICLFMCNVYLQPYNDAFYSSISPNSEDCETEIAWEGTNNPASVVILSWHSKWCVSVSQGEPGAMGLPGLEGLPGAKVRNSISPEKCLMCHDLTW